MAAEAGAVGVGTGVPSSVTYWVIAGVAVRICSRSRASFSTRSGVAWARFFDLQPLVLRLQAAGLADGAVQLGEQQARLVLRVHEVEGAGQHAQQQHEAQARHAGTSVRSATRITALRARGLASTSQAPGLMRSSAFSRIGCGAAKGARRS